MSRSLDGEAFKTYCRRLGFKEEVQEMIARIHASKPSGV
jgi:hypothetical protein